MRLVTSVFSRNTNPGHLRREVLSPQASEEHPDLLNPEAVKRREYCGMATFVLGLTGLFAGMAWTPFILVLGAGLIALGSAVIAGGLLVLSSIPNIVALTEDSWLSAPGGYHLTSSDLAF